MGPSLSETLQSRRYRLLFHIYWNGKLKVEKGMKARLQRAFEYESDSSFHNDWKFFQEKSLIREDENWVRITRKGQGEFLSLGMLLAVGVISIMYAIIFIVNTVNPPSFPLVATLSPWLTGFVPWIFVAFASLYTFRVLRPRGPLTDQELQKSEH